MVATGEHWYGTRALERKLIDIIETSDDYLLAASKDRDIFEVHYKRVVLCRNGCHPAFAPWSRM